MIFFVVVVVPQLFMFLLLQFSYHDRLLFSTSVELEPEPVCVRLCVSACLYVLQALGCSIEGINGQICLKSGTLIVWVNPWGSFFSFFENFDFWAQVTRSLVPKWTKNLCSPLRKA